MPLALPSCDAPRTSRFSRTVICGKQRVVLQNVSAAPLLGRTIDACFAVEQQNVIEQDSPAIGPNEPGDAVEDERFAGPARSEKTVTPWLGLERDIQVEKAADSRAGGKALRRARPGSSSLRVRE